MLTNKIGVIADTFKLPIKEALIKAKEVGAEGVQIYAVSGEMDPDNLSKAQRADLKAYIDSLGLSVTALCGDLGGHGFQDKNENPAKIEKSKKIMDLAFDLGTNIVTTHIGIVPHDPNDPVRLEMQKACNELAEYANKKGGFFAIETGPERAENLKSFLDSLNCKGVAVNFDPANMVMVWDVDPSEEAKILADYIVHTHVKDGIRVKAFDPRDLYGALGYKGMDHEVISEMVTKGELYKEEALGEGKVNFDKYFKTLQDIGYTGWLTIEREAKVDPSAELTKAVNFIKNYR